MNPHMGASTEGYFDNLVAAAMTGKYTLAEMVRAIANLTNSNEVLTNTNAALSHHIRAE